MPSNSEQTLLQEDSLLEGDKAFSPREELNGIRGSLGSSLPSVWWDGGVHGSAQRGHCKEPGPGNHKARPSDVFSLILFFSSAFSCPPPLRTYLPYASEEDCPFEAG